VYVAGGSFTLSGGEISGNSSTATSTSSPSGGGVYVAGGSFTLSGGEISGNSSSTANYRSPSGGGVYVNGGSFTMNDGEISGNSSTTTDTQTDDYRSPSGGGVYVDGNGSFTMSDGEISGNIAVSKTIFYGGGVYMAGGSFTMSGGARVNLNNPVRLADTSRFITIGSGGLDAGADPVALVEPFPDLTFIGKPAIKEGVDFTGTLPVDRFKFASGWTADADGTLDVKALPLTVPGEPAGAYLAAGSVHFYRFTPNLSATYSITKTGAGGSAVAWADGEVISSSPWFTNREEDIIIMISNGTGTYTIKYNLH
jgi:hypothetical protein